MIQLNKFEPFTVELEETRSDVSIDKAAKLRSELFNELSAQADKLLKRAIKEYRER